MAAATTPVFVATPKTFIGRCTVVNTARDGTGTIASIVTPGADGSLIEGIELSCDGTSAAGFINLFVSDDAGVTWRFWRSIATSLLVASATVDAWQDAVATTYLPLALATTQRLGMACTVAGNYIMVARGGNY